MRSLAAVTGVGKSKIGYMLRNRQMAVTAEQALAIAEALDIPRAALFAPITSAFKDTTPGKAHT